MLVIKYYILAHQSFLVLHCFHWDFNDLQFSVIYNAISFIRGLLEALVLINMDIVVIIIP